MYDKLVILNPFLFHPKKISKERKKNEVAKPLFNHFFIAPKSFTKSTGIE